MANPAFAPPDMPLGCAAATEVGVLDAVADWAMNEDVGVGVSNVGIIELEGGVGMVESLDNWLDGLWVDELDVEDVEEVEEDTGCALVEELGDCAGCWLVDC